MFWPALAASAVGLGLVKLGTLSVTVNVLTALVAALIASNLVSLAFLYRKA